jgi:phage/plasmid primase-like uncharacterized protein
MTSTFEEKFLNAMVAAGLEPNTRLSVVADGALHRYRVTGDKAGSLNGWLVLHAAPIPAGAFGSWKTGESHTWRDEFTKSAAPADRAELARQMRAVKAARQRRKCGFMRRLAPRPRSSGSWLALLPATTPTLPESESKPGGFAALGTCCLFPPAMLVGSSIRCNSSARMAVSDF